MYADGKGYNEILDELFARNYKTKTGNMLLDIEPVGALHVREIFPEATLIYIAPPSMEELEKRLRGRGDTTDAQITKRLGRAQWEIEQSAQYDHRVINDRVEACVEEILKIMEN